MSPSPSLDRLRLTMRKKNVYGTRKCGNPFKSRSGISNTCQTLSNNYAWTMFIHDHPSCSGRVSLIYIFKSPLLPCCCFKISRLKAAHLICPAYIPSFQYVQILSNTHLVTEQGETKQEYEQGETHTHTHQKYEETGISHLSRPQGTSVPNLGPGRGPGLGPT